jgi:hypothetical protein
MNKRATVITLLFILAIIAPVSLFAHGKSENTGKGDSNMNVLSAKQESMAIIAALPSTTSLAPCTIRTAWVA